MTHVVALTATSQQGDNNMHTNCIRYNGARYKRVASVAKYIKIYGQIYVLDMATNKRLAALPKERSPLDTPEADVMRIFTLMLLGDHPPRRMGHDDFDLAWHKIGGMEGCLKAVEKNFPDMTEKQRRHYCDNIANVLSGGRDWRKIGKPE